MHTSRRGILMCVVTYLLAIASFAHAQSIPELKSKAEDGDVQAQLTLAKAYHLGEGIEKDEMQAVHWWEKAAEHGDASAQINLGVAYSRGAGVPKNYVAAARWYTKAADQGNAEGQRGLALQYHLGEGVPKDDTEAIQWYTKAANQGNVQAQSDLAALYHLGGQGVPQDDAAAVKWWQKAADQGDATAQGNLGTAYGLGVGVPKDEAESVRWHTKAAENGNAASQFTLGMFYVRGAGVPKDEAEGVKWLHRSAEQGNAQAQYNLGMAYRAGVGVEKDNVQAYFWIAIAASSLDQGVVRDYRDKVEAVLTPAQLADVQDRIRKWKEAHPSTQVSTTHSAVAAQTQAQDHPQDQQPAPTQDQVKPVFLITNCVLKSGSMIQSAFNDALTNSKKYELVHDLSDKGKMDVVITVKMICEEDKGYVAVASIYGAAKCFGPRNCHVAINDATMNALLSEPGGETQSGINLFKGFDEAAPKIRDQMILSH
jgi:TPR repeat protein